MIPPRLAALASRIGLTGLAIAVLCALLAVQTIRLEGFRIWPLHFVGALERAENAKMRAAECENVGQRNLEAQRAQKAAYEAKYKELANNADERIEQAQADIMAAADRYIASHRVRLGQGGVSATGPTTDSGDPGVSASVPANSFVAVSDADLRACSAAAAYALEAHNWALGLAAD